jgi:hypothetical protein
MAICYLWRYMRINLSKLFHCEELRKEIYNYRYKAWGRETSWGICAYEGGFFNHLTSYGRYIDMEIFLQSNSETSDQNGHKFKENYNTITYMGVRMTKITGSSSDDWIY